MQANKFVHFALFRYFACELEMSKIIWCPHQLPIILTYLMFS